MSIELFQALTDENPVLQKQVGCMSIIFQMFNRHHVLNGKQDTDHNRNSFPSGDSDSHLNNGNLRVQTITSPGTATDKNSKKRPNNQRTSIELSGASFSSSSCSSSFPSPPVERTQGSIMNWQKINNSDVNCKSNRHSQSDRESIEFRGVVKDSIYGESRRLSVKTTTREELANCALMNKDSLRPLQLSQSGDGSYVVGISGKPRMSMDNESLRVQAKLRGASCYHGNARESPRSSSEVRAGSLFSVSQRTRRFSYDERDIPRPYFDSSDTCKSTMNVRELPRLSLDSSIRSSNYNFKTNPVLKDLKQGSFELKASNNGNTILKQDSGNYERHPSIVAKLMGLEAMPNSSSDAHGQMGQTESSVDEALDLSDGQLSRKIEERKQHQRLQSPRSTLNDRVSRQRRNSEEFTKPSSSSNFRIQTALSRQLDGGRSPQRTAFVMQDAHAMPTTSLSVYGEIEKRFQDLEFQQSNKDLRALKHVLKAIQVKGLLEAKEVEASAHVSQKYNNQNQNRFDQNQNLSNLKNSQNHRSSAPIRRTNKLGDFLPPNIIRRPELIDESRIPTFSVIPFDRPSYLRKLRTGDSLNSRIASVKDQTSKGPIPKHGGRESATRILSPIYKKINGRNEANGSQNPRVPLKQDSPRPQRSTRENVGSLTGSSGSCSPRVRQRKIEFEKRCRLLTPSSQSSGPHRQPIMHQVELDTSSRKQRPKLAHLKNDDQLIELCSEPRNLSCEGDVVSMRSHSTLIQHSFQSPCRVAGDDTVLSLEQKESMRFSKDGFSVKFTTITSKQQSPVSVLDASFYGDELLPSPVKKISTIQDDETKTPDDILDKEWNLKAINRLSDKIHPNFISKFNHKKLENVDNLVQKLRQLELAYYEFTTDHIGFLCEDTNPDHKYISEILLASGLLLKDHSSSYESIQLHPSGHLIDPDIFMALEGMQLRCLSKAGSNCENILQSEFNKEKLHRKLIFDIVNEILVWKLAMEAEPWLQVGNLVWLIPSRQLLLRGLCSEIDQLQGYGSAKPIIANDMTSGLERWIDSCKEFSDVVLDIERLIFKDMIDEIVSSESSSLQLKLSRQQRQLFTKCF